MTDCLFKNKVLLVLGCNVGADDIVRYARVNGAYTIVADYYPPERSSSKRLADEAVLISTADLVALGKLIEERHVDGILAGISEFNLKKALTLSEKYNLPFYCTSKQWNQMEIKTEFRELCVECGVPCPITYYHGNKISNDIWNTICYPVIIKPVDSCSSAGVHICENEEELRAAEIDALENSKSGNIILEQYIRGVEFTAHYTICNGTPTLSCVDNRYPVAVHDGNVTTIPVARIYPSLFLDEYLETVNDSMYALCKKIGINNGVLFIQGMYNKENGFSVFEGGMRSAAEAPYRLLSVVNGVNYINLLVDNALLGHSVSFDSKKEDPFLHGRCCGIVSFVAKGGVVGNINGLEDAVAAVPSVLEYENRYPEGTETPDTNTLHQLMIRFVMVCNSREEMARDVKYLNSHINVLNVDGEEMVIKMEPERIFDVF